MRRLETFMVNGFLESGKTEFIKFTIEQPYFKLAGKALIIACEEGEVEYEESFLKEFDVALEVVDNEEDFHVENLIALEAKHRPKRIIVEYNGMWNYKDIELPSMWQLEQQITMIDATTFKSYFENMKSMILDMARNSEMVIFNRCDKVEDLSSFKRNIKMVNQQGEIIFEGANGEIPTTLEEELPYDIGKPTIKLDNDAYPVWFFDMLENTNRYIGKKIEFEAEVLIDGEMPTGYFIPGRVAMTCCEDDLEFLGFFCSYEKTELLVDKSWVKVKAVIGKEYFDEYNGEGPVLYGTSIMRINEPKNRVLSFK